MKIKGLLLDLEGVIYEGDNLIDGAIDIQVHFREPGETNSYFQPDYRINSIVDLPNILEIA